MTEQKTIEELKKKYDDLLNPARLEGETQEEYRNRQKTVKKKIKEYLKGKLI